MEPPTHAQREQVNSTNSIQTPAVSDSQQIELRTVSMNGNVINNSKKTEAQVEEMSVRGIVPDTDTPQPQQSNKNAGNENNENKDVKTDIESQKVVNIAREDVEPYSEGIYGGMCSLLFVFVLFVIIASVASDATWQFWLDFIIKTGVVFLIAYVCGLLAQKRKLKVNYTRKIIHFSVFFIPPLFDLIFAEIDSEFLEKHGSLLPLSNVLSFSLFLALFSVRMRRLVPAFDICFYALDRPEDRPNTMLWLSGQLMLTYVVLVPFLYYYFAVLDFEEGTLLVFVAIIINGIGDGLAEPVGIRFGKHKYKTRALCTNRTYTRSYEGSACVWLSAYLGVLIAISAFTTTQFIIALIVIPPFSTLAEAFSPHTVDAPALFLVVLGTIAIIIQI